MIKILMELIRELLDQDYEKIKFLAEKFSYVSLQNKILDGEDVNLYKKAWKKKSGLEYPYVYNNNYEVCEYLGSRAEKLRGLL